MTDKLPYKSLYPAGVDEDAQISTITMLDAWRSTVEARTNQPAVFYFDQTISFCEIDQASDSLAVAFQSYGVVPGDRVAAFLQNDPQWLVTLVAAWKCGASVACVNPMLRQLELAHHLGDAAPAVLVCLDQLYGDVVEPMREELDVRAVITTAPWDMMGSATPPDVYSASWGERQTFINALDWLEIQKDFKGMQPASPEVLPSDVAVLTYTSGTTGRAKGAMNLHSGMVHSSRVFKDWFSIDPDADVILGIAPLFHITGSVAVLGLHILSGAPIVLLHRFDAALALEAIERRGATFTVAASTAYNALSNHSDASKRDLSSLTKSSSGGAPLSRALVARVRELTGWTLEGVYGLTETTSPATICPPGIEAPVDPESGALSVGIPVPGADVRIVDVDSGVELPVGSVGEIAVRGPMVVPGYWEDPEESAHAIREGQLFTGDVGVLNADGWLFVVDRKKDLINAGGYKIWPRDVEDVLCMHPAVREAAVVGIPDEYRGETVKAFISLQVDAVATPEAIIAFCKENIAAYKYPRIVEIVDELPKNASGKILRRELRSTSENA